MKENSLRELAQKYFLLGEEIDAEKGNSCS
jgi:hypothetical protein